MYLLIIVLLIGVSVTAGMDLGPFNNSPAVSSNSDGNHSSAAITAGVDGLVGDYPPYVDALIGTQLDTDDLVKNIGPAVVSIVTESISYTWYYQAVPETGAGTGIITSPDGWILTNYHVVDGATKVTVTLSDGSIYKVDVNSDIKTDSQTDLAVVKIDASDLPYLHLLNSSLEQLDDLDPVVAVGNALALSGGPTWTTGVVSNLGRSITEETGVVLNNIIQTDAAINPGNSGGPLVNMAGQVVGINVAIASNAENIGFAISTDTAIPVIRSLIEEGQVDHPYLGVQIQSNTSALENQYNLSVDNGVLIVGVISSSPADDAGLKQYDVVTNIDGKAVNTVEDMIQDIQAHNVGDEMTIIYYRGDDHYTTTATLTKLAI